MHENHNKEMLRNFNRSYAVTLVANIPLKLLFAAVSVDKYAEVAVVMAIVVSHFSSVIKR